MDWYTALPTLPVKLTDMTDALRDWLNDHLTQQLADRYTSFLTDYTTENLREWLAVEATDGLSVYS